jgi:hypothetical protein
MPACPRLPPSAFPRTHQPSRAGIIAILADVCPHRHFIFPVSGLCYVSPTIKLSDYSNKYLLNKYSFIIYFLNSFVF